MVKSWLEKKMLQEGAKVFWIKNPEKTVRFTVLGDKAIVTVYAFGGDDIDVGISKKAISIRLCWICSRTNKRKYMVSDVFSRNTAREIYRKLKPTH